MEKSNNNYSCKCGKLTDSFYLAMFHVSTKDKDKDKYRCPECGTEVKFKYEWE